MFTFSKRRYKYATIAAGSALSYSVYHKYMESTFDDQIRLVFPNYKSTGKVEDRTV